MDVVFYPGLLNNAFSTVQMSGSQPLRPQPGNFVFIRRGPGKIDARARYRAAARQLRNTGIDYMY
jgi:hypothetical protein